MSYIIIGDNNFVTRKENIIIIGNNLLITDPKPFHMYTEKATYKLSEDTFNKLQMEMSNLI